MDPTRTLVAYYSRSGTTRTVARAIRDELGCDIERVADRTRRRGALGYLRSGFDATFHRSTLLRPMSTAPDEYDVVIVGTPVWNGCVSPPIRSYLAMYRDRIQKVAFFSTRSRWGIPSPHVFRQMEEICGRPPVATLALRTNEVSGMTLAGAVRTFVSAVRSRSLRDGEATTVDLRTAPA
jgi:hypothetical protein